MSVAAAYPAGRAVLREVGLRDGLQLTKSFPSTAAKIEWLRREHAAGVRHFEVGSFLPATSFPQFADVREVLAAAKALPGTHTIALTLNARGIADALATEVDEVQVVISASEAHNLANARRPRAESLAAIAEAVRAAKGSGKVISAGIAMALGCSLSGPVDHGEVVRIAAACLEAGVDMVGIADTVGYGGPRQVGALCAAMSALCEGRPYVVHLHDTRGMGVANAFAALQNGARVFDASLGGLGGCPFAPGATGNVVMEDLVYLLETSGHATGIDLEALVAVREVLAAAMPDEPLHGTLASAGAPQDFDWRATAAA